MLYGIWRSVHVVKGFGGVKVLFLSLADRKQLTEGIGSGISDHDFLLHKP